MNNNLLSLLVLLVISSISFGAEMRTLEIEFFYPTPDDPVKQLHGYKLYKDGMQVCKTDDPSISKIACQLYTEEGTFDFTLTAHFSDGTESPPSPSFPLTINSLTATYLDTEPSSSAPPTVVIFTSTAAGNAPLNVTFSGTSSTSSDSSLLSYIWTFGDGAQGTSETTSHTFTTAGTYYTKLTVVDNQGLFYSAITPIIVTGNDPANKSPSTILPTNPTDKASALTILPYFYKLLLFHKPEQ